MFCTYMLKFTKEWKLIYLLNANFVQCLHTSVWATSIIQDVWTVQQKVSATSSGFQSKE